MGQALDHVRGVPTPLGIKARKGRRCLQRPCRHQMQMKLSDLPSRVSQNGRGYSARYSAAFYHSLDQRPIRIGMVRVGGIPSVWVGHVKPIHVAAEISMQFRTRGYGRALPTGVEISSAADREGSSCLSVLRTRIARIWRCLISKSLRFIGWHSRTVTLGRFSAKIYWVSRGYR